MGYNRKLHLFDNLNCSLHRERENILIFVLSQSENNLILFYLSCCVCCPDVAPASTKDAISSALDLMTFSGILFPDDMMPFNPDKVVVCLKRFSVVTDKDFKFRNLLEATAWPVRPTQGSDSTSSIARPALNSSACGRTRTTEDKSM